MRRFYIILVIGLLAGCQKSGTSTMANYTLTDSCGLAVNIPATLQINPGTSINYKGMSWTYNAGYYFNGLNYIYLYSTNNDSIYIRYPDTTSEPLSVTYLGYKN